MKIKDTVSTRQQQRLSRYKEQINSYQFFNLLTLFIHFLFKQKIDSAEGRAIYSQRLGTVEPVFGNLTEMIGIKRFSLRGKEKVDGQWKLMAMLYKLLKIHRYGASYAT